MIKSELVTNEFISLLPVIEILNVSNDLFRKDLYDVTGYNTTDSFSVFYFMNYVFYTSMDSIKKWNHNKEYQKVYLLVHDNMNNNTIEKHKVVNTFHRIVYNAMLVAYELDGKNDL